MDNLRITSTGIKREARGLLANNWSRALGALCIYLMVLALFMQISQLVTDLIRQYGPTAGTTHTLNSFADYYSYFTSMDAFLNIGVAVMLAAFFFLLSSPLSLGITYWYRKLSLLEGLQVGQIFHYYQSNELFFGAVIFQGLHTLARLGIAVAAFLPAVICFSFAYSSGSTVLVVLGIILAVVGLFGYGVVSLRFFFAKYLYCGEYGYGAMDCLRYSAKYMKKHVGSVLSVIVSFAGWFASCVFILPLAYVVPFYSASMAACAQDIIDEHMRDTLERLKKH